MVRHSSLLANSRYKLPDLQKLRDSTSFYLFCSILIAWLTDVTG